MSPFRNRRSSALSALGLFSLSLILSVSGCGKKAALYHPDVDKGNAQSDQSFVFPPKRTEENAPSTTDSKPQ